MPTIAPFDSDGHCLSATFLNNTPVFVMASGVVHFRNSPIGGLKVQDGISSVAMSPDQNSLITGGEDGQVFRLDHNGATTKIASIGNKWVTSIAYGGQGYSAFAASRNIWSYKTDQALEQYTSPRSAEGLAFAPKGLRLAIARYNGVTLRFLGTDAPPTELEWKGAHHAVTFSPDARYVITAMQENALHGWRLSDQQHLRMSGYPTKVKSISWSYKGKWLATSGAAAAIIWPFQAKGGPMGKTPLELATRSSNLVTCVCCHPSEDIVAIGFDDGMVVLARFSNSQEVLLRKPGQGAITTMGFDQRGNRLAFGSQAGECGVVDLTVA